MGRLERVTLENFKSYHGTQVRPGDEGWRGLVEECGGVVSE
jgi:chromosome segregation ATPase